ncbi:TRAP transporter small permease [Salibacterium qingdaonense]|uniref:TRAP-type C4-dicarboxylate transport system, small permease component n=1 Tax=Salibacterium qingdaonense TaxID=266892 RepID=A0A1I4NU73_9BACI|nr:TRAP transporter small permease [Salibacterium qingdaonense]SFM19074.1 TRAP-type C4-dicarboxylate transport system, small permease component [Salibacterium qingdaonense]
MTDFIRKTRSSINQLTEIFTATLVVTMVITVAAQVYWRYVLDSSLAWSEELSRFLFIWIIFLGSEIAFRKNAHIAVDSLFESLKGKPKIFLSILIDLIIVLFAVIVLISGIKLFQSTTDDISTGLNLPMSYVYLSIPVSMGLIIFNKLYEITKKLIEKTAKISES